MSTGAIRRLAFAVACAFTLGCAGTPRPPERRAALAHSEVDPACRGTVQGMLAANGLERVTVQLAVGPAGRVDLVEVLSPDLTPAAKLELRHAMEACVWARPVPQDGAAPVTATWFRERAAK